MHGTMNMTGLYGASSNPNASMRKLPHSRTISASNSRVSSCYGAASDLPPAAEASEQLGRPEALPAEAEPAELADTSAGAGATEGVAAAAGDLAEAAQASCTLSSAGAHDSCLGPQQPEHQHFSRQGSNAAVGFGYLAAESDSIDDKLRVVERKRK